MSKLVSRRIKDEEAGNAQALIFEADNGWRIEYYDPRGTLMSTELHERKSLQWAEDAAENWALGIKVLNG